MKRALVSGNAGFIGKHFQKYLDDYGWLVDGFDLKNGTDALDFFNDAYTQYDLLIHAAANVGGRAKIDGDPLWIMRNVEIDRAALNWAGNTDTRMLYFSSSAAYPTNLQVRGLRGKLKESNIDHSSSLFGVPDNTYGWSKLTGERMVEIARAEGARVSVVRPFSGYGSDQSTDYPFGSFLAKTKSNSPVFEIWGDGTQTRDWIHIRDILPACMNIVESGTTDPVNLCTGRAVDFTNLAKLFLGAAGTSKQFDYRLDAPQGVHYRVGDPTRMYSYYIPRVTLEEGITEALS